MGIDRARVLADANTNHIGGPRMAEYEGQPISESRTIMTRGSVWCETDDGNTVLVTCGNGQTTVDGREVAFDDLGRVVTEQPAPNEDGLTKARRLRSIHRRMFSPPELLPSMLRSRRSHNRHDQRRMWRRVQPVLMVAADAFEQGSLSKGYEALCSAMSLNLAITLTTEFPPHLVSVRERRRNKRSTRNAHWVTGASAGSIAIAEIDFSLTI